MDTTLWVPNGYVLAAVRDGNTVYIGGDFTVVGPHTGGGVSLDAASGAIADPFPRVSGIVQSVVPDGSGGWYIGGLFSAVGGAPRSNLAHILGDGSVSDWNPGATGNTNPEGNASGASVDVLVVNGNTVYVGGDFTAIGGQQRYCLGAVDATTGAVSAWAPDPNGPIRALAVSGNTVYVGGDFGLIGGQQRRNLAALDAATGAPTPWRADLGGNPRLVYDLAVSGNIVYVGGIFSSIAGQLRKNIAAVEAITGMVTPWSADTDDPVNVLAVSGSTVYVGGGFRTIGGQARGHLAAFDATTGNLTPWNPDADRAVKALAVSGSTVYAGGSFASVGGQDRTCLVALDAVTGAATGWNPTTGCRPDLYLAHAVVALAVSGGQVYVGGTFSTAGGEHRNRIAALDAATGRLTSWNPGANARVLALVVSGGTVYAGGNFTRIGGQDRTYLVALDATTGSTTPWTPDAIDGPVYALAVSGSTVYIGGAADEGFRSIGGQARYRIGALDVTTGRVTSWDPNPGGLSVSIFDLVVSGNTVYAGGTFTTIGGQERSSLAALDATTGAATSWNPAPGYGSVHTPSVHTLAVSGGLLYVGGRFSNIGGQARGYIAALDPTTGEATAWDPSGSGDVNGLAMSGGTVYAGGDFTTMGGQGRSCLAAVDAASGAVRPWNPGTKGAVFTLTAGGGVIYVGGMFVQIGGQARPYFAAFTEDFPTPTLVSLANVQAFPDRVELTWEVGGTVGSMVTVQRSEVPGEWRTLQTATIDGSRRVFLADRDVEPGRRYDYRIGFFVDGAETFAGEVWAEVPALAFSLRGSSPNPSAGRLAALFTLPVHAPATLELLDVTGRRVTAREVGSMGVGAHSAEMTPERPLPAGLYWLRLTQQGKALTAKRAVVR